MARSVLASSFCSVQGPDSLQKYGWVWGFLCPALHHHRIIAIASDRDVVSILLSLPLLNLASQATTTEHLHAHNGRCQCSASAGTTMPGAVAGRGIPAAAGGQGEGTEGG